jgi:hypothetical protein
VKGRCLAITQNNTYVAPELTAIQRFFGQTVQSAPLKTKSDSSLVPQDLIDQLESLISILPDPNIQCVRPENVKTKVYPAAKTYYSGSWAKGVINTAPYKLKYTDYQYPLTILVNNLEKHYDYHKIAYISANLNKMTVQEIESRLAAVYAMPDPNIKPVSTTKETSPSSFITCPIKVMTDVELALATKEQLAAHHDELDTYYYGKAGPSILESEPAITRSDLIDYITELYLNIYDEEQEDLNAIRNSGIIDNIFEDYEDFIG